MNLHIHGRVGVVLALLMLCAAGDRQVFAEGGAGGGTQAGAGSRKSAGGRKRPAPPREEDSRVSLYLEEGLRHADEGNWAEALKSYRQAIALSPQNADAHVYIGDAYMSSGKYEEAFAAYKEAIRVAPRNAEAHYSLGAAYNDMAMYGTAFKPFVQAIRLDPAYAEAYHGIGYAYLQLENFKDALGYLRQAIRLSPDYPEAHLSLGLTYLGLGQLKAAEQQLKVLEGMDQSLAREMNKAMQSVAAIPRPAEPAKPAESNTREGAARGLVVSKSQPVKPEPVAETPQQQLSQPPNSQPQLAEVSPAVTPPPTTPPPVTPPPTTIDTRPRPAQGVPTEAKAEGSASLLAVELSFWDSIKNSTDPEEFAAYLRKYPEGAFAELAKIRRRAFEAKRDEAGKAVVAQKHEAAAAPAKTEAAPAPAKTEAAAPTKTAEAAPVEAIPAPAAPTPPPAARVPTLEETLTSLRKDFRNKFTYKATAPGSDPNVASVTSEVLIDYEPLQFEGCSIEWRDVKDILSVVLADLDPAGVKVEARSRPNTTFSIPVWNLSLTTAGGRQAIREFKGDGSGAVNNYNGLDLQFNSREKADAQARLLQRAIKLCSGN
jgi:tetratricopeptide (TPR) repeat protein